jgi:hypothetical protein
VNAATAAGYATLAIDRLGVGASSAPPAGALAVPAQASALSQIVRALRTGAVAPTRFGTIIGVGPAFAGRWMPYGYLTTKPGSRLPLFHNPNFVDARVVYLDEKSKATSTADERASIAEARQPGLTEKISVPVLVAVGQQDSLFCDPANKALPCANPTLVLNRESSSTHRRPTYRCTCSPKPDTLRTWPPNAPDWYKAANDWADQWISRR